MYDIKEAIGILNSGNEIPILYRGREYNLRRVGKSIEWYDNVDNMYVNGKLDVALFKELGTSSEKFKEAYTAENRRIRQEMTALSMKKKNGAERMNKRIKSLILCLTKFEMPPRGIISADIDDLTDYATFLVRADNGLLRRYGFNGGVVKNEDVMPFVEKDLRYIRKKCNRLFQDKKVKK